MSTKPDPSMPPLPTPAWARDMHGETEVYTSAEAVAYGRECQRDAEAALADLQKYADELRSNLDLATDMLATRRKENAALQARLEAAETLLHEAWHRTQIRDDADVTFANDVAAHLDASRSAMPDTKMSTTEALPLAEFARLYPTRLHERWEDVAALAQQAAAPAAPDAVVERFMLRIDAFAKQPDRFGRNTLESALRTALQAMPHDGWRRECDDVDSLLRHLALDPQQCRSDGGSLNLGRIKAFLAEPQAPLDTSFDGLAGRGLHELRFDELPAYLAAVATNRGPQSEAFTEAATWVVAELKRKTNDEGVLAVQLDRLKSQAVPQAGGLSDAEILSIADGVYGAPICPEIENPADIKFARAILARAGAVEGGR